MKTAALRLALLFTCAACAVLCRAYTVKDARGTAFEFDAPPQAATLVPAVSQDIYAIGADKYLLANSRYCVYPEGAKNKIKIGGFIDPDYEKIAELKPQIFILPTLADSRIEDRLAKFGIKCFILHKEGVENIEADIKMLGELFQMEDAAKKVAEEMKSALKPVPDAAYAGKRALFMFGNMAAGKGSFVGDMLDACGLKNAADEIGKPWPVLNREFILTAAPEILFVELPGESERETVLEFYRNDPVWKSTPAVRNSRICLVPREHVTVPSPRILKALEIMREFCVLQYPAPVSK